jgi:energy-coupling factor transporter ATP-binding protein EcfA2
MTVFLSPYPGLRPFDVGESLLFFGREEQTDELLRRLHDTRFLAVVGSSGCGKSSLVRAGMISSLQSGFMVGAGSRWRFAVMRPGAHPLENLATALVDQDGLHGDDLERAAHIGVLGATLRRGPLGLVEELAATPLPDGTTLLVLVDQFEEIFRFRRGDDSGEADAFVALLLASARQRELPIYIVITMRSDFFGDCATFTGLPEQLNRSQYLTPRLTRDQRHAAITGPARVFEGDVAPDVVNRLLNEMRTDPDQLPLMQHLLMRMWTWQTPAPPLTASQPNDDESHLRRHGPHADDGRPTRSGRPAARFVQSRGRGIRPAR